VKDAVVSPAESTLLDGHVVEDVKVVHIDMCVRKGAEPAAEEFSASLLALSAQPARRFEDDIIREQRRKPFKVVSVEGFCSSLERFARRHGH
jgi:hypothetical protein